MSAGGSGARHVGGTVATAFTAGEETRGHYWDRPFSVTLPVEGTPIDAGWVCVIEDSVAEPGGGTDTMPLQE